MATEACTNQYQVVPVQFLRNERAEKQISLLLKIHKIQTNQLEQLTEIFRSLNRFHLSHNKCKPLEPNYHFWNDVYALLCKTFSPDVVWRMGEVPVQFNRSRQEGDVSQLDQEYDCAKKIIQDIHSSLQSLQKQLTQQVEHFENAKKEISQINPGETFPVFDSIPAQEEMKKIWDEYHALERLGARLEGCRNGNIFSFLDPRMS